MNRTIDISHKTIFFITGFLLVLWSLYQITDVIVLLFIAIIFMSALSPIVNVLEKIKVPRTLGIAIVYILVISLIAGLLTFIITPLIEETANLSVNLPQTLSKLFPANTLVDQQVIQQELTGLSKNLLQLSLAIFNNFLALISIAVLTFYLLLERDKLDGLIAQFFIGHEERIKSTTKKIEEKLGAWMRGQLALSLIIGSAAFLALTILGVPYALPLAILAGAMEIVPVIGPIISSIPAILVAYTISPFSALLVGIAYFIIQQLENNLIVPQVMRKAVGLNPLIIILAVAIGGKLLGVSGALLAVPIAVVVQVITEEIVKEG